MKKHARLIAAVAGTVALIGCAYGGYKLMELRAENAALTQELASAHAAAAAKDAEIALTTERLALADTRNAELSASLRSEEERNNAFAKQIGDITESVGTLEKLSKTDEELLKKYSKVYFLNEHYVPSDLADIQDDFLHDPSRDMKFHAKALPELEDLVEEAKEDGIELRIVSAYRSFGTQAALKSNYTMTYGTGANTFSADQGYSEHQLGTTVDFTTPELGASFSSFGGSKAYEWLLENAHEFGFILSYPKNNAYYQFEPWHWRYVGAGLARHLKREDINFYDADQRMIDSYLVSIFE